jgi:hypothetical protein
MSLRFLLTLFLTVALDLSSPIPTHAWADAVEEAEEASHGRSGHRRFRLVRETVAPVVAQETRAAELQGTGPRASAPARPATRLVSIRKLPPALAEPAAASEDH